MNLRRILNGIRRRLDQIEPRLLHADASLARTALSILRRWNGFRIATFGANNRVELGRVRLKKFDTTFVGSGNRIVIRDGATVTRMSAHLCGSNSEVVFERDVKIDGLFLWITGDNAKVLVGRNSVLLNTSIYLTEHGTKVEVGEDCMFAGGTTLRCGDGHTVFCMDSGEILNRSHHITIGDHVWLTSEVLVLKDVTVGSGSVVGSRSVVTRDIPVSSLAAGVPAKLLRSSIGWRNEHIDGLPEGWFKAQDSRTAEGT